MSDPTPPGAGAAGAPDSDCLLPFLARTDLRSGTVEQDGCDAGQMLINATLASNVQLGWASSLSAAICKYQLSSSARALWVRARSAMEQGITTEPGGLVTGL